MQIKYRNYRRQGPTNINNFQALKREGLNVSKKLTLCKELII
jgi:hypothetical protein